MGKKKKVLSALTAAALMLLPGMPLPSAHAASHREAPLIANDPTADITDVYAFRSWEDSNKVVFIMNVIPAQEPSAGPNYYNFDDNVLYDINIDTDKDGKEDVTYRFTFTTEFRGVMAALQLPVANAAVPAITALDGSGSEGLGVRQSYTVTEIRGKEETDLGSGSMFAVPSNMGPATMPDYEALAATGIYSLANGGRVFAGQRDETFYIDLGAVFDTINLRAPAPILDATQDGDDTQNFGGVDHFSGFNVNSIAIEVPISALTDDPNSALGVYAATSRNRLTLRRGAPLKVKEDSTPDDLLDGKGKSVQVARMANPLVNELIIGTPQKDRWNATAPENEASFLDFYRNPRLTTVLNLLFGTSFPDTNRNDLTNVLLKYPSQTQDGTCSKANSCSELLRLVLAVPPTAPESQKRLTVLAGDSAGWPNGRRPNDDVTDFALRVVAGLLVLPSGSVPNLGDGVNFNIGAPGAGTSDGPGYGSVMGNRLDVTTNGIAKEFPFLPTPHDGRNRRHIDCGEPGGNAC
jgi:hypothetical protein